MTEPHVRPPRRHFLEGRLVYGQAEPGVDHDARAVDIARRRAGQENDGIRHLLRHRRSPKRAQGLHHLAERSKPLKARLKHRGVSPRRAHRIDADMVLDIVQRYLSEFSKESHKVLGHRSEGDQRTRRFCDADNGMLRRRVCHHARSRNQGCDGADVDDRAAPEIPLAAAPVVGERFLRRHGLGHGAHAEHRALQVDFDCPVEDLDVDVRRRLFREAADLRQTNFSFGRGRRSLTWWQWWW